MVESSDSLGVSPGETGGWPDLAQIREYYDDTHRDYRMLWLNPTNRAMHFGFWDQRTRSHGESLLRMNEVLAEHLVLRPGHRVLDAGCGVGGSAIWLAKTRDVQVTGITPVQDQVRRARQYAKRHGVADRVTFEEQDYTRTTFADASFDAIWAMESVCHAPDKGRFFREARRVIRLGGRLGMVEYLRTGRSLPSDGERLLHDWLDGWAIPDLATREELVAVARDAGFTDLRVHDITANVRPSLRRLYWICVLLGPTESVFYLLGLRTRMQHGNAVGGRKQYRALQRGFWFYGLITMTAE
ncbi:MAG TPA: methyltransferase domain-containing protein [Chloroflexota bacterium]